MGMEDWIKIDLSKISNMWQDIKGVYKIKNRDKVIYVGESKCLKTRLFHHLNYAVFYGVLDNIEVELIFIDEDTKTRKGIESKWIKQLDPPKNGNKSDFIKKHCQGRSDSTFIGDRENLIIDILKLEGGLTIQEMCLKTKKPHSTIWRGVGRLKKQGLITWKQVSVYGAKRYSLSVDI